MQFLKLLIVLLLPISSFGQAPVPSPTPSPTLKDVRQVAVESNAKTKNRWFFPDGRIDWEAEMREKNIDKAELSTHHTGKRYVQDPKDPKSVAAGLKQLSDDQRENLYIRRFTIIQDPEPFLPGTGIKVQSGHKAMIDGKYQEVFFGYHDLILSDGTFIPLLKDTDVAWSVRNWDRNMKGIAIALDGSFTKENPPPPEMLEGLARRVAYYMAKYPIEAIFAHKEIASTECPGDWWNDEARKKLWDRAREILAKRQY